MKLSDGQYKFIMSWGSLGSQWGMNKTLAQIHGLFLITEDALCTDEIMETLKISRGNANMNIRALLDWGMIYKELIPGERKEYFIGEKDMWLILKRVMKVRKERELDPMLHIVKELKKSEGQNQSEESEKFIARLEEIEKFANQADKTLSTLLSSDESWFFSTFMRLMK